MLNDWGIHHFHISEELENDGFVKRDNPLLFVVLHDRTAYFLDIGDHGSFSDDRLIKIAVENWPDEQIFTEVKGLRGSRQEPHKPHERAQLRNAGIASFVQIGNRIFFPPGGISTAGTSTMAARRAGRMLRTLRDFEIKTQENPSVVTDLIERHSGQKITEPDFEFAVHDGSYGVFERKTSTYIKLGL